MVQTFRQLAQAVRPTGDDRAPVDKQSLALDALSKLTLQFAQKPDCHQLLDVLILTISGQFAVSSAFAVVRSPGSRDELSLVVGSGRFKGQTQLARIVACERLTEFFLINPEPLPVECSNLAETDAEVQRIITDSGVKILAPLVHGDQFVGLLGLGPKVTRKELDSHEMDLLATLANTIAPFVANSFLFMEIAHLSSWYLEIVNSVRQGVYVFDSNGRLKMVNSAGRAILEVFVPDSDILDHNSLAGASLEAVFPENRFPGWTEQIRRTHKEKFDGATRNLVARSLAGESIFNAHVTPVHQMDSPDNGFVLTLDNITAQKENEQRLFSLEKFADKGVMASSIAHELNNFLGLILGGVELTQLALQRGNVDKALASLEKILANGDRMKRFTQGLTDFTRLETRKAIASLNDIITDVLSFVRVQAKFKSVRITTDLDSSLPMFEMDADQIAQLLLNMLNNAADAITEVERSDGLIHVTTGKTEAAVCLTVQDNGIGIAPEVKEQLFRVHLTTKKDGHGYGLVTCAKIIEQHHAQLQIDSEIGQGSTFRFQFPTA
jgi:two-component system, NtrC family, sensor kinase